MFNPSKYTLVDHASVRKLVKKYAKSFESLEVLCVNDFRSKLTYQSNRDYPVFQTQSTTSVLFTVQNQKRLYRHSWVCSGWEPVLGMVKELPQERSKMKIEPSRFEFNGNQNLPVAKEGSAFKTFQKDRSEFFKEVFEKMKVRLSDCNIVLNFFLHFDRAVLENTCGNAGSYEHPYARLEYSVTSKKNDRSVFGLLMNISSVDEAIDHIESRLRYPFSQRDHNVSYVKNGQTPVILSPWVVSTLAQMMFECTKVSSRWPDNYPSVIPREMVLYDDPTNGFGQNSTPFDHEGSKTSKKVLVRQGQNVQKTSDLQTGTKHGFPSSGNGYRRGLFVSHIADLTPVIQPNYMMMEPGNASLEKIIGACEEFVLIDTLTFPLDRFFHLLHGQTMVTIEGSFVKRGKVMSRIITKNFSDRPLISSFPRSHGSLLDSSCQMLAQGEHTYSGWYPYIFIPKMTWSSDD